MTYSELLKGFAGVVYNEKQYEKDRIVILRENNYKRAVTQFRKDMEEYPVLSERYSKNISKAKQIVEKLDIVHNTNIDSVISIFANGKIMCADELKAIGFPYRKRVSAEYLKKNLNSYVYGVIAPGEKLFGPIEIVLKRDVEQLEGAIFIFKNHFAYTAKGFSNSQMSINKWRTFLAEKIATEMEDVAGYLMNTPTCERVEFYFPHSIDLEYIDRIVCCNKDYYSEMIAELEKEFGSDNKYKELLVLEDNTVSQRSVE